MILIHDAARAPKNHVKNSSYTEFQSCFTKDGDTSNFKYIYK